MKQPNNPGIEPLETRIAPAVTILHPLFDIKGGVAASSVNIDLAKMVDASASYRTIVEFVTNFTAPGQSSPGVIRMELFDDKTPLTVQNFLSYVNNVKATGDYDGTYFHRLVGGFVLQGGGYNPPISINNLGTHVDTPLQVHNEFHDADAELDPVTGTVAMAKVGTSNGGGPNSATSEFFVNYADNSSILDDQNGGFTVFGKVIQGMDIVTALANLRRFQINALTGSTNGDGIPTTAGANTVASESQLIKIVDARVVAPTAGDANGHSFSNLTITALSGEAVVSGVIDASNILKLDLAPNKAGVAKVQVTVTKNGESAVEEFTVTALPNLVSEVSNNIGGTVVPGQKGTVNVQLINNGAGIAKGDAKVRLFLSEITAAAQGDTPAMQEQRSGFTLEVGTDIEITADVAKPISILSGKTLTTAVKYAISADAVSKLKVNGNYRLLALVESTTGTVIEELFTDDNVGNITDVHTFKNAFGSLGAGRDGVTITMKDGTGSNANDVTLVIKGPGSGEALRNTDGTLNITLSGTTLASSFSVTAGKGIVPQIGELHVSDAIGKLNLKNIHLISHLSASGGVKSLTLGDIGAEAGAKTSNLSIGGVANLKTSITLGIVRDYSVDATSPIKSLTAKAWLNTDLAERETLELHGIGKLTINGDFAANIDERSTLSVSSITIKGNIEGSTISTDSAVKKLTAGNVTGASFILGDSGQLASLSTAKGTLTFKSVADSSIDASYPITTLSALGWADTAATQKETLAFRGLGTLNITGDLGANVTERSGLAVKSITVSGGIRGSVIQSAGDIASVKAATLDGVSIFAGVTAKPTVLADLASARKIGSISTSSFLNTTVVGSEIGKIAVNGVDGVGAAKFGFYANAIKSYVRTGGPKLSNLTGPAAGDTPHDTVAPNYEVRVF